MTSTMPNYTSLSIQNIVVKKETVISVSAGHLPCSGQPSVFFYQSRPIMVSFPRYYSKSLYTLCVCVCVCVSMCAGCTSERESVYACVCMRKTDRQTENKSSEKALKKSTF